MTQRPDNRLVADALAGDSSAVAEIYDRYADRIYSFCVSRLRNAEQAADATHETFVKAAMRLATLRDPSKLRSWLFAIARNQVVDQARHRGRTTSLEAAGDVDAELPDHDTDLLSAESAHLLWEAAGSLQERDMELLELQLRQGLEGAELADALGVTPSHLHTMQSRLRDRIEKALGSLLIARHGQQDCAQLRSLLAGWDGRFTLAVRSQVTRHVESCDICAETRSAVLVQGRYLGVLPLVAAPTFLRAKTAAAMESALGISPAPAGPGQNGSSVHGEPGSGGAGASSPGAAPTAGAGAPLGAGMAGGAAGVHAVVSSDTWAWRSDGFPEPLLAARRGKGLLVWLAALGAVLLTAGAIVAGLTFASDSEITVASQGDDGAGGPPPAEPTPTPVPTTEPTATPAAAALPPTAEPTETPTTGPTPTALPTPTPRPTATPLPTATPRPTLTPTPTPTTSPTPTPTATPTPTPTPTTGQTDTVAPDVARFTVVGTACTQDPIDVVAAAFDNVGVDSVQVDWTHDGGRSGSAFMKPAGNNQWVGTVGPVVLPGNMTATATATDAAGNTGTNTITIDVITCFGPSR